MKVAVIGCGTIGSAFARHLSPKHKVILVDINQERGVLLAKELGAEVYARQTDAVKKAEVVILAVKPSDLMAVAEATADVFSENQLLVSVLTGTTVSTLKEHFTRPQVLRIMPNLAITCGQGVIGMVDEPGLKPEWKKIAPQLFEGMGFLSWIQEDKIDALAALTGAGPAFIFVVVEAMIESGIYMGMGSKESKEYALKTLEGAAALLRASEHHPGELKWKITSPGGITIAGLKMMEQKGVRGALLETFISTFDRAKEILK